MPKKKGKPLTREDVLKAIEKNGGTAKGLDLSGKEFEGAVDLSNLKLAGIILRDASLERANLERTNLTGAHLEKAWLADAHLEGADLEETNLQKAWLMGASLEGAYLGATHLEGANLQYAHLEDTWLDNIELSNDTRLENIHWGNYVLSVEREDYLTWAINVYRQLKTWHINAGIYDIAGEFFYREMEAQRKARSWRREPHLKLWSWAMRLLCGYGERLKRMAAWITLIVFGFAAAYYFWGSFSSSSFLDTLYYSAASFTALGYGQWAPQPSGWAKGMGAAEAFIGVSIMALFLVTLVRKMTR